MGRCRLEMPGSPLVQLALFFLGLLGAGAAPAQVPQLLLPLVKEGATVRVSEHVYLIPDDRVPMVPNVGIIVGTSGTLVVDPGMGRRSGEAVLREVAKLRKGGPLYIVNTHYHTEHTTGEVAFPEDARVIRAAEQQRELDELGMRHVERFGARSLAIAGILEDNRSFRAPAETFEREKMLDLGGVRVRLMMLGPGHTRGDTVAFVEEDRVLFSGDLAMNQLFPAFASPQSSARTWLASLDVLAGLQPKAVIGAHYPMGDASVIGGYRDYLQALQARVAGLKAEGKLPGESAKQAQAEFGERYRDWAQPARIQGAVAVVYREATP